MENELKELGFSDNEAKVYLASLKLASASVARIAEITDLPRPTVYDILDSLTSKGLVTSFKKEKKLYYSTLNPRTLLEQLKEKEEKIKQILPELEKLKGSFIEKPSVEIYEGTKAVISLLNEIYSEKELLVYGSAKKSAEVFKHLPENFARKRAELGIKMRAILEKTKETTFRIKDPLIKKYTEIRFSEEMSKFPTVTFIFGKKIAIITLEKEIIGVKIEDENINKTQKLLFEMMWNMY